MEKEYKTVKSSANGEFTVNRSRFICHIIPITTEDEATAFIGEMRRKFWDATHNVYAYILREGMIRRYSDDGEPQGTAGIPVLDVLQKEGLTDCCVVVTRYFGGVLLGAGGLVRAYGKSAHQAVELAGVSHMKLCRFGSFTCEYTMYGKLNSIVPECGGVIMDTTYADTVTLHFAIPFDNCSTFEARLTDASFGSVSPDYSSDDYMDIGG